MASGGGIIPKFHALKRKPISCKGIAWLLGDELFEEFAS